MGAQAISALHLLQFQMGGLADWAGQVKGGACLAATVGSSSSGASRGCRRCTCCHISALTGNRLLHPSILLLRAAIALERKDWLAVGTEATGRKGSGHLLPSRTFATAMSITNLVFWDRLGTVKPTTRTTGRVARLLATRPPRRDIGSFVRRFRKFPVLHTVHTPNGLVRRQEALCPTGAGA